MLVMVSGTKIKPMASPGKHVGPHHVPGGHLQVDVSKSADRVGQDEESKPDQQPRVDS